MTAPGPGFAHVAAFYDDLDGFLAIMVPFLRAGVAAGEPALVAVGPTNTAALQAELPDTDGLVTYTDMTTLGRNPGRIISAWAEFADEQASAPRLRGIGEPVWHGRDREEISECHRHEALLNLAFAGHPGFELVCPYDRGRLDGSVIREAGRTHPVLVADGERSASPRYDESVAPFAGELAEPSGPVDVLELPAHAPGEVRRRVADRASTAGVAPDRVQDLVLAVGEAATNTLRHGGGRGTLHIWEDEGAIVCELRDRGRIEDPMAGRLPADPLADRGRGLWLIHQLCDLVQVRSSGRRNAVRMRMTVTPPAPADEDSAGAS